MLPDGRSLTMYTFTTDDEVKESEPTNTIEPEQGTLSPEGTLE